MSQRKIAILGNESDCCGGPELPAVLKLSVQEAISKARVEREDGKRTITIKHLLEVCFQLSHVGSAVRLSGLVLVAG